MGLAYYRGYTDEIDSAIAENRRSLEELLRLDPVTQVEYIDIFNVRHFRPLL